MACVRSAVGLLVLAILAGCAADTPSRRAETATPMPSPSEPPAASPLGAAGAALAAGVYTRTDFRPSITFAVGDGWTAEQVAPGFFDVEQDPGSLDVIAVQFGNVAGAATAQEAIDAVTSNVQLVVGEEQDAVVGGHNGTTVVIETADAPDTSPPIFRQVLSVTAGPISIASGRRLQLFVTDTDSGVLAIMVGGSIAEWDRTLETAQPVLDSITIGD